MSGKACCRRIEMLVYWPASLPPLELTSINFRAAHKSTRNAQLCKPESGSIYSVLLEDGRTTGILDRHTVPSDNKNERAETIGPRSSLL